MRKRKGHTGLIFLCILIIIIGVCIYLKTKNNSEEENSDTEVTEATVEKMTILNAISNSSYVESALTEKVELHTTYYFEEIYYEKNQIIKEGENILKYTNGTYLIAPYNCIITEMSIPNYNEKCTSSNYITIESTDILTMSLNVEEDELSTVYIGQEAQINVDVLENNTYTGYVTNIGNTGTYSSNGSKFAVTVEFENDGNILIGMSANCNIILEKAENVIVVPNEAITTENKNKYVKIEKEDGSTENREITIGISNDAYTEIKSNNLEVGETVLIEKEISTSNNKGFNMQKGNGTMPNESKDNFSMDMKNGDMPSFDTDKMPSKDMKK